MMNLLILTCVLSVSSAALLNCNSELACPNDVISCECSEAGGALQWTISSPGPDATVLCEPELYRAISEVGAVVMPCGPAYSFVLDALERRDPFSLLRSTLTLTLNFTTDEDVVVTCADQLDSSTTTIQVTSSPSPPEDLQVFVTSTTGVSATVRVEWDPPVDNGGATITSYQILVNSSTAAMKITVNSPQQCYATIALNSTGVHIFEVQASNCAGTSSASTLIDTKGLRSSGTTSSELSTTNTDALTSITTTDIDDNFLLKLDMAGVAGVVVGVLVVMVLGYTCGLL